MVGQTPTIMAVTREFTTSSDSKDLMIIMIDITTTGGRNQLLTQISRDHILLKEGSMILLSSDLKLNTQGLINRFSKIAISITIMIEIMSKISDLKTFSKMVISITEVVLTIDIKIKECLDSIRDQEVVCLNLGNSGIITTIISSSGSKDQGLSIKRTKTKSKI